MATLAPQALSDTGAVVALVAASAGGDQFPWAPNRALIVNNGGGASINVTIPAQNQCNHGFTHDRVIAIPAGQRQSIKLGNRNRYVDTNGYVQVAYSAVTSVTVGVEEV